MTSTAVAAKSWRGLEARSGRENPYLESSNGCAWILEQLALDDSCLEIDDEMKEEGERVRTKPKKWGHIIITRQQSNSTYGPDSDSSARDPKISTVVLRPQ